MITKSVHRTFTGTQFQDAIVLLSTNLLNFSITDVMKTANLKMTKIVIVKTILKIAVESPISSTITSMGQTMEM